jgi:hypothetical protein
MSTPSVQTIVQSGLIPVASAWFSAGVFTTEAMDCAVRGNSLVWFCVGAAIASMAVAFIVIRRALRRLP